MDASLVNVPDTLKTNLIVTRALELNSTAKRKYIKVGNSDNSLKPLPSCNFKKPTAEVPGRQDDLEL